MTSLFPGRPCEVSFRPTVSEGKAVVPLNNTILAKAGSKVKVTVGGKAYYLSVELSKATSEAARDNIQINGPNNTGRGQFERISKFRYRSQKIRENPKAGLSLVLTACSILSAAAATISSSQHSQSTVTPCSGLKCVTPLSWGLIGIAALSAVISWWKDNATFL